jgi:hypothetical protein
MVSPLTRGATYGLICPCLIGPKDLMRRSKSGALGDIANAGSDKVFVVKMPEVQPKAQP